MEIRGSVMYAPSVARFFPVPIPAPMMNCDLRACFPRSLSASRVPLYFDSGIKHRRNEMTVSRLAG